MDNHLWLWAAPDGRIFHAGPSASMNWIDVSGSGTVTSAGTRGNDTFSMKGTTVMFDTGKILKVGGATSYGTEFNNGIPANEKSFVIDINNPNNVTVTATPNMQYVRTMHNSTVLPDGKVLVTGGLDHAEVFSDTGAALPAELYDPVSNTWETLAAMATPRTYHSVGILMTDGRVFVGGGGLCDGIGLPGYEDCTNHFDAEVYSPPYLFTAGGQLATRPSITNAPATADYDTNISVTTNTAVTEFSLIRFSAATHSTNNEQRRIPLATTGGTSHSLAIPGRNLLPPGYYMLFGLNAAGVPSVAHTIRVGNAVPLTGDPNLVMHLKFDETSGSVAADASGNNNDGTIFDVTDNGATKAPSTDNWSTGLFGGAAQMDGETFQSNTIVDVPYSASLAATAQSITVMAWVDRDDIANNVGILTHDYPAMFFGFHNNLYKWEFATTAGGGDCYSGYSPAGQWVHIAATYDGTTARLFANGVEVCTQAVSGDIIFDATTPNFSSFASSGFYETRDPATNNVLINNNYNQSGVTDEISGKIDELKVYNNALGAQEIKALYDAGVAQGVPACPPGTITAQYRIGTSGPWTDGNVINAPSSSQVYIRAVATGTYYVTTAQNDNDSPTFESGTDFTQANGYLIDPATDIGANNQLTLTTAGGCPTVVTYNSIGECTAGETPISAEWQINDGAFLNGNAGENVSVTITEGDKILLSVLPNQINGSNTVFDIILPNGTRINNVPNDYVIQSATSANDGAYQFVSDQGCSVVLNLTVSGAVCDATDIKAQWKLNGQYVEAPDEQPITVSVNSGEAFEISMVPENVDFTINRNGSQVYQGQGDYDLGNVDATDSGDYVIITTSTGCTTTLTLNVSDVVCDATTLRAEWSLNNGGSYDSAVDNQPVTVVANIGDVTRISMLPNGINFTVTYDGNVVYDNEFDYILGAVTIADSGDYIIRTEDGCETTLTLDVLCPSGPFTPEYTIDGVPDSGENSIAVNEGTPIILGTVEDNVAFTITPPSGPVSNGDLDLGNITAAQVGIYTFTSSEGCSKTLNITVNDPCSAANFTPRHTIDGVAGTGMTTITVDQGTPVVLDLVQTGVSYTITLPDDTVADGAQDLGEVTLAQAGDYVYNTSDGCTATITLVVNENCPAGSITPEYTIDSTANSGDASITVELGTTVALGVLQTGLTYTITAPDDTVTNGVLDLGGITLAMAGNYVFTSDAGCSETLNIIVTDSSCDPSTFVPQYTIDGTAASGNAEITIPPGSPVILGIVQSGTGFTITGPDATVTTGILDLGSITAEQAGVYTFSSDEGCSAQLTVIVGVEPETEAKFQDVIIYPNPVRDGVVKLVLDDFMNETINVSFYDIYGKLVIRKVVPQEHEAEVSFDMSFLSDGTYIIEMARTKNDENAIKKVIKLRQ
ncbi:galactose oxidase-like domain-containing protein [Maribacter halichondriae]|uniref:galactose oxidase-like domain-containing protein n=1 Tax=Maribacter halichondriae TaxID=2980554 RepID=UPI002359C879|nr:galactose oxidase-like domain-containing protein [Maribacter sp. Hal144]